MREVALLTATFPPDDVGDLRTLAMGFLITFILVFVVIPVATDDRVPSGVATPGGRFCPRLRCAGC